MMKKSSSEPCYSKDCKKNTDRLNNKIDEQKNELYEANIYRNSYKLEIDQLEGRLAEYKEREVKYIEKIRTLEMYRESNLKYIERLKNEVETLKEEKDVVDGKFARLLKSSKYLENIIESQRSENVKEGGEPKKLEQFEVLTVRGEKERTCPMNTHKSTSPRPAVHKTHRPQMRGIRPNVNDAQPKRTSFYKLAHSYNKRSFQRTLAVRSQFRGSRVPTVNRKFPTVNRKFPTGNTKFPTVDMGNKEKANRVAERRNKTLIEAARTVLADAKLPVTFWAEVVNTACYVQNRVLVNKSQNKTPYELFNGRTPAIGFLKPFGCHVMILNTLDNLGRFKAKGDEGYFIGYFMSSKAFRCQPMNQASYNSNPLGFDQPQPPQSSVIHQPPQELSIQEMEDLKQQYLDELKRLSNLEYRNEEQWAYLSTHPPKCLTSFCYDDDEEDYTSVITPDEPVLSTEEPDNSLSMGDEHLDTILVTESDEFIKYGVKTLIPIPKFSSIDDDFFSIDNIDYVEASPPDSKLVSSEEMEIVIPEVGGIDNDILLTIKNDILREKLLNVNLFISKIKALNANPTPSFDCKTKSSSTSLNSLLE
nr:retrovirus-related Pol polyprotein from transposon TNT 1-94 [Tanacetum cinerariifolium]